MERTCEHDTAALWSYRKLRNTAPLAFSRVCLMPLFLNDIYFDLTRKVNYSSTVANRDRRAVCTQLWFKGAGGGLGGGGGGVYNPLTERCHSVSLSSCHNCPLSLSLPCLIVAGLSDRQAGHCEVVFFRYLFASPKSQVCIRSNVGCLGGLAKPRDTFYFYIYISTFL